MVELLIEAVANWANWAIWKSVNLSPAATRRFAVLFLWICALATVGVVVALLMLSR